MKVFLYQLVDTNFFNGFTQHRAYNESISENKDELNNLAIR